MNNFYYVDLKNAKTENKSPLEKIPKAVIFVVYALTFLFYSFVSAKLSFPQFVQISTFEVPFIVFLICYSAFELGLTELYQIIYYFFATSSNRYAGGIGVDKKTFSWNLRCFLVLRNIAYGGISFLFYVPNYIMLSFVTIVFEFVVTAPILFGFFFYMKKHYFKKDAIDKIFMSLFVPYVLFSCIPFISVLF